MFTNHIYLIYMYQLNMELDNQKWLVCHKTKPNRTEPSHPGWNWCRIFFYFVIRHKQLPICNKLTILISIKITCISLYETFPARRVHLMNIGYAFFQFVNLELCPSWIFCCTTLYVYLTTPLDEEVTQGQF